MAVLVEGFRGKGFEGTNFAKWRRGGAFATLWRGRPPCELFLLSSACTTCPSLAFLACILRGCTNLSFHRNAGYNTQLCVNDRPSRPTSMPAGDLSLYTLFPVYSCISIYLADSVELLSSCPRLVYAVEPPSSCAAGTPFSSPSWPSLTSSLSTNTNEQTTMIAPIQ
jgi:hypothetical protein